MDRVLNVSDAEIQDALASMLGLDDLDEDDPSFFAIGDLAAKFGMSWQAAAHRLKRAVKEGRAEERHVRRPGADGRMMTLLVYRPIQAEVKP